MFWEMHSHEGGAHLNGISALIKEKAPSPLPPYEDTVRRWLYRKQEVGTRQTLTL